MGPHDKLPSPHFSIPPARHRCRPTLPPRHGLDPSRLRPYASPHFEQTRCTCKADSIYLRYSQVVEIDYLGHGSRDRYQYHWARFQHLLS
jgi:hypothetical protein